MAFDSGSIPQPVLDELFAEHRATFDQFIYRRPELFPVKPVNVTKGTAPVMELQQGRVGAVNPSRATRVAKGQPTPKGNSEMSTRPYVIKHDKWAEGLNEITAVEAEEYTMELEEILKDRCGFNVLTTKELDLEALLKGQGVADEGTDVQTRILGTTEKFNYYGTVGNDWVDYSDVDAIITKMVRDSGGGNVCIMGRDVADALRRHPQLTSRNAGQGVEIIGYDELLDNLMGMGLDRVIIGRHYYHDGSREVAYDQAEFFSGTFAVFRPGAIKRFIQSGRDLRYDSFDDIDTEDTYLRARESSNFWVPIPENVQVLTTILG